jgi:UPF0716 family protein affecting phage T7 exclusion
MLLFYLGINNGITTGDWIGFFATLIVIVAIGVFGFYFIGYFAWKEFQAMCKNSKKDIKGTNQKGSETAE